MTQYVHISPIISIIVPVYNASSFLGKCLQSIAAQTMDNIEVLLIDDGSTDDSLDLCMKFASTNEKFKVFSKNNEGGAIARNFGFDRSSGGFICYVDPDDWIEASMCQDVVDVLSSCDADFANFGIDFISSNGKLLRKISNFQVNELVGAEILINSLIDRYILTSPNNKVYRRSFLLEHEIRFPPIRAFEDYPYTREVSLHAKKAVFISNVYYHVLVREGSLTRNMNLNYFNIAREAISIERAIIAKEVGIESYRLQYMAHVVKVFSSLLIKSAFRISSYDEYRKCFAVAEACEYFVYSSNSEVIDLLGFRYYFLVFLCRNPLLLRVIVSIAKLARIELD